MIFRFGFLWLISLFCLASVGQAETLYFRSDYYCPYVCDPSSSSPGYMVEILRHIFPKAGIPIDIKLTNWARAIKETRENIAQGLIATSRGDAPDFVYPHKSLGVMKPAFFTLKESSWRHKGRHSLLGAHIGVINGYWYGEELDRLIKSRHKSFIPFSGERPLEQLIKMLKRGRLEAFIENKVVLQNTLKKEGLPISELIEAGSVKIQDPYLYVAFSPKNARAKAYAQILSEGLEEMRRNGELRRILVKYQVDDWVEESKISISLMKNFSTRGLKSTFDSLDVLYAGSL